MRATTNTKLHDPEFVRDEEGTIIPTVENFYNYCSLRRLMGSRCKKCGMLACPPRRICQGCLGAETEWVELNGTGALLTYTIIHFPPTHFQSLAPYAVGIVKLDEGPNLPAMIKNVNFEKLKIGIPLQIDFEISSPEDWPKWPRYYFKPGN